MKRLSEKVCVVTGTGGSIGRAASDESSFVTGIDIKVDGGMAVW